MNTDQIWLILYHVSDKKKDHPDWLVREEEWGRLCVFYLYKEGMHEGRQILSTTLECPLFQWGRFMGGCELQGSSSPSPFLLLHSHYCLVYLFLSFCSRGSMQQSLHMFLLLWRITSYKNPNQIVQKAIDPSIPLTSFSDILYLIIFCLSIWTSKERRVDD